MDFSNLKALSLKNELASKNFNFFKNLFIVVVWSKGYINKETITFDEFF